MKNSVDKQYIDFLKYILENGELKEDRTGTGTISIFDYSMTFDMSEGFPLLTSKKVFTKAVIHELIWFLRGDTNIKYLVDNGVNIWNGDAFKNYMKNSSEFKGDWPDTMIDFIDRVKSDDEFAKKWGDLGPVYGKQWRNWKGYKKVVNGWEHNSPSSWKDVPQVDQIADLIRDLKNNPDSRRLMVSAWNPGELDKMVLPPCHYGFQCYTNKMTHDERRKWWCSSINKSLIYSQDMTADMLDDREVPRRKLSLKWNQRSVDSFLGLPFNIASYGILLHLLAREVNMVPNQLKFSGGDCHIYTNHVDQVKQQLTRETFGLCKIELNNISIDNLYFDNIKIINYESSGVIKAPLSN
jgi:thymidylate synthase